MPIASTDTVRVHGGMTSNTPFKALAALVVAQTCWGLSPLYYKAVDHVPSVEVLAHRSLWTLVFFGAWIALQRRLGELVALLIGPDRWKVALAGFLVSSNWGLFIYAVQSGQALEGSLGYYIFPLVAAGVGFLAFRETFKPLQYLAFALASVAVVILGVWIGALPWLALLLAFTFAGYGAIKKTLEAGPILSVLAEVVVIAPLVLGYLTLAHGFGVGGDGAGAFGTSLSQSLVLMFAGVVTGVPLLLFTYAARRLPFAVSGMSLYINSTIQFLLAVFVFAEPFGPAHAIAMPMIWIALILFSVQLWRDEAKLRKAAVKPSTSATEL